MAELPFFPLAIDAYLADCGHLSDAEHGRYLLILMEMWRAPRQRLPNDDAWLARRFRRSIEHVAAELRPLISEFCKCDGNWITQKRLAKEFHYVTGQRKKQSARAKSRWNKDKPASPGNAGGASIRQSRGNAPTPTPTPTPHLEQREKNGHARAFPIGKDWNPKPETVAELKRQRPDLVGEVYEAELIEFRLWCRANAVSSHDPEATFMKFMRRAKGPSPDTRETFDQRRIREARAAVAAVRIA